MFYFAYGSNLNTEDLRHWCTQKNLPFPLASPVGPGWLPDHQLLFNYYSSVRKGGALNIRPKIGYAVPGVVFSLTSSGREVLNIKERAPEYYQEKEVTVLDDQNRERKAITFTAAPHRHQQKHIPPDSRYKNTVTQGLTDHGIDHSCFQAACKGNEEQWILPLFVYGTLMQDECNHGVMGNLVSPSPLTARTPGLLRNLGSYPGMVGCKPGQHGMVHGELFSPRLPLSSLFTNLDRLEGFAGYGIPGALYTRIIQKVETKAGNVSAWTYLLQRNTEGPLIVSGDWKNR